MLIQDSNMDGIGPNSLQNFIKACRGEEYYPGATATVGLKAVAVIDAMYRSTLSGKAEPCGLED